MKEGYFIGRILLIEFKEEDATAFDEVMAVLKRYQNFEKMLLKDETVLSLLGLEIYPDRRKIYRDRREINLTVKEYDLLCLLVENKGRVLTYEQIYQSVWGKMVWAMKTMRLAAISVICVKNSMRQHQTLPFRYAVFGRLGIVLKWNQKKLENDSLRKSGCYFFATIFNMDL